MDNIDYKKVIFSRYIGQYLQATEETATIRKSSEDIQEDLMSMARFSIDEISRFMVMFQYSIGFENMNPVWLMRTIEDNNKKLIDE